jgi:ferredoxin
MVIITKEQVKKLRDAWIDVPYVNETCIGCSACVAISPDVFELNEEWKSEVIYSETYDKSNIEDSISACPVNSIGWEQ